MPPFDQTPRPPQLRSDLQAGAAFDPARPLLSFAHNLYVQKDRSVAALGLLFVRQVKLELSKPGKGRIYVRGARRNARGQFRGRRHQASAPGAPPAVDLGRLRGSMDMERMGWAHVRVGTNVEYAPHLEPPATLNRPFMRTALATVQAAWKRRIATDLNGVRP
jgi:hypothetical protein